VECRFVGLNTVNSLVRSECTYQLLVRTSVARKRVNAVEGQTLITFV
jgi:hypothetical protein